MSARVHDDSMSVDSGWGRLKTAGSEAHRYRIGHYFCADGVVAITEYVRDDKQTVRLDTIADGRFYMRTLDRGRKHLTERGMYIVAGRWLRSLLDEIEGRQ